MRSVAIVGLGYVGLPLSAAFAQSGMTVTGIDTDPEKLSVLVRGESYIEDVPDASIQLPLSAGNLHFTKDYSAIAEMEAVVICLPTPLTEHREPDLSTVVAVTEATAKFMSPGTLVVLESTTYPGTTRELLLPILERDDRRVGEDFYLAFSPERVDPGNRTHTIQNTPKIVGGVTTACLRRAKALYEHLVRDVHEVSSPEIAEMSKLLENIFRGVNIALVNELAILCERMDIDVWEVVEAAKTKPFGFMPFYPGPGLGGHCIPIDPFYLSWRARAFDMNAEFIELAGRVNVNMPYYAISRVASVLNTLEKSVKGSRVLILGMSYKPDVGDLRESPSLKILQLLLESGAEVVYHDPHIPELPQYGLSSTDLTQREIELADCVVIATDHTSVDLRSVVESASRILDLRNAVRKRLEGRLPENVDVL